VLQPSRVDRPLKTHTNDFAEHLDRLSKRHLAYNAQTGAQGFPSSAWRFTARLSAARARVRVVGKNNPRRTTQPLHHRPRTRDAPHRPAQIGHEIGVLLEGLGTNR
jgi:hypothetical protein